ncbi:MAG: hypothetical protein ACRYE9_03805, partial [Janthinobacterium lividum]
MSKHQYILRKVVPVLLGSGIAASIYPAYDGYHRSISPSKYESATGKLGFSGYVKNDQTVSTPQQQEALLKQLKIAGCFAPQEIWQAINRLRVDKPEEIFKQIYSAIKESGANQKGLDKFNVKLLRKNLAKVTDLSEKDVVDFILTLSQTVYGRKMGQERNELTDIKELSKYEQEEYFNSAKILRLIDREAPQSKEYDEVWIAGASRVGVLSRLIDYKYIQSKYDLKIDGQTLILAGQRELWANIDGITPKVLTKLLEAYRQKVDIDTLDIFVPIGQDKERNEEGKHYMSGLAARFDVKLDQSLPFIQYATKEECTPGRFPNRLYANYEKGEDVKLTETMMSQDLVSLYKLDDSGIIGVIDTLANGYQRPDTSS